MSKRDKRDTPTRARVRDTIRVLEELKRLLILAESDPLSSQSRSLYDNVESTLREAHRLQRREHGHRCRDSKDEAKR
jgi:hypothetical protein